MKNTPVWMDVAKSLVGTKEVPGAGNNSVIMGWAKALGSKVMGIAYAGDHVPWCGLFVSYCLNKVGFKSPSISVRASSWGKWGVGLSRGAYGAVLVFTREGGGHVGFYVSEDATHYHVLGGNQADSTNVTKIAKSRCTAIRWPGGYGTPSGGPIVRAFAGPTSTNEA